MRAVSVSYLLVADQSPSLVVLVSLAGQAVAGLNDDSDLETWRARMAGEPQETPS